MLKIRSLIVPDCQQPNLLPRLWRLYSSLSSLTAPSLSSNHLQKCIKTLLSDVSRVVPDTIRRLRRAPSIRAEDILELLTKFESECEQSLVQRKYAESMWEIFRLFGDQHFSRSWETMSSILLRQGMLREIQLILFAIEKQGIGINTRDMLCKLIEGYVRSFDLDRAILSYEQMKDRSFNPNLPCYCVLIEALAHSERSSHAYRICLDMLSQETEEEEEAENAVENVAELLLKMGMVEESRTLIRKALKTGLRLSEFVLNEIAIGYSEKRDFDDVVKFLAESKCVLSVASGNKIINSLCSHCGVTKAEEYRLKMEKIGAFSSNEITYAILIGWCCKEGKMKSALVYLSELLSRGMKPNIWSYNALLGGVFSMNLTHEANAIFDEMIETGVPPSLTTFRILIAGYCKGRDFDLVKRTVLEMRKFGFEKSFANVSEPLPFAFSVLGIGHLDVSIKRDNSVGLWKFEFYDRLGNGLYLDTNLQQFDDNLTRVLQESYLPRFDSLIRNKCLDGDFPVAFSLADEMSLWGQELSLEVFLLLLNNCSSSVEHTHQCLRYIERTPMILHRFDGITLGFLMKLCSSNGFIQRATMIHDIMLRKAFDIPFDSLSSLQPQLKQELSFESPAATCRSGLVNELCGQGRAEEAISVLDGMLKKGETFDSECYDCVIGSLCGSNEVERALDLTVEMVEGGMVPRVKTWEAVVDVLCREGRTAEAEGVVGWMRRLGGTPTREIYCSFIKRYRIDNEVKKATEVMREMQRNGHDLNFDMHWSLIRGINCGNTSNGSGLLSRLLFGDRV